MRLIHTKTLELEEFFDDRIPKYAILSHTWGAEEVFFQDMQTGKATAKVGYQKIKYTATQAAKHGYNYVWVDTCCIDKTSSAELSEAINSMYKWYEKSEICYAFLEDYDHSHNDNENFDKFSLENSTLAQCRWFSRGWTLQELIAPRYVEFYDRSWVGFGTKSSLVGPLEQITGIDRAILRNEISDLSTISIAKRMSWASKRQTTRAEDVAYSLLGLFDINMPLLYGEGKKAFTRLLEEILKNSDDHSIFAWEAPAGKPMSSGLLAESPEMYMGASRFVPFRIWGENSTPYVMTNKGLSIELDIANDGKFHLAGLNCWKNKNTRERVCIRLSKTEGDQYFRTNRHLVFIGYRELYRQTIFVRSTPRKVETQDLITHGIQYRIIIEDPVSPAQVFDTVPLNRMDIYSGYFHAPYSAFGGAVRLETIEGHSTVYATFGGNELFNNRKNSWCLFKIASEADVLELCEQLRDKKNPKQILQEYGWTATLRCGSLLFSADIQYTDDIMGKRVLSIKRKEVAKSKWGI